MRKEKKNVSMLYIANWFEFGFIIMIAISMFFKSTLAGGLMLICAAFCSPFMSKKLLKSGKFSKSSLFISHTSLFLILWIVSVAVGTPKVESVPEPTRQIIAEETTTEPVTEPPTEPITETEPETIPETTEAVTEPETEPIPIELDSLQNLFISLSSDTTIDEIDNYISNNGLVKSAFTGNEAYYIGYENKAVLQRERDRYGYAVDISFFTSGKTELIGKVKSAKYEFYDNTYISQYVLTFQDGCFYIESSGNKNQYDNGEEAMQEYLKLKNK